MLNKNRIFLITILIVSFSQFAYAAANNDGTGINSQILWRTPGPSNFVSVESSDVLPPLNVSFGTDVYYMNKIIGLRVNNKDYWTVNHLTGINFDWAVGFMNIFQLGFTIPVTLYQKGEGASPIFIDKSESAAHKLNSSAIGDMRLHFKTRFIGNGAVDVDKRGLGLALDIAFSLPTGDEDNFAGDKNMVFAPALVLDMHHTPFSAGINVGARLRSGEKAQLADSTVGNQLSAAAGLTLHFLDEKILISMESNLLAEMDDFRRMGAELRGALGTRAGSSKSVTIWLSGSAGMSNKDEPLMSVPKMRFSLGLTYVPGSSSDDEMDAFFE
ncbi:MAG: hypothetical protein JXR91_00025 [Deltaproteobacteria bacterium]|nr:hypothetical protein [Deltaproteobacteria bacterium]